MRATLTIEISLDVSSRNRTQATLQGVDTFREIEQQLIARDDISAVELKRLRLGTSDVLSTSESADGD